MRLPTLGEEFEAEKVLDRTTDRQMTRTTGRGEASVDAARKIAEERTAYLRRHRQIHPTLAAVLNRTPPNERLRIATWIYVNEDVFDKGRLRRETPGEGPPLVASREAVATGPPPGRELERPERERPQAEPPTPPPARGAAPDPPPDPRLIDHRRQVHEAVSRAA